MHFIGYVIGEDVESKLAPFDENMEVEPYKSYDVDDNEIHGMYIYYLYECVKKTLGVDITAIDNNYSSYSRTKTFDEKLDKVREILKENGDTRTIEEFFGYADIDSLVEDKSEDWSGRKYEKDSDGWFYWSTFNPKSEWDWYQIGGRWSGFFELKEGAKPLNETEFSWCIDEDERNEINSSNKADSAYRKDIVNFENIFPYFVVIDGEWISKYEFEKKNSYVDENNRSHWDFDKADQEWREFLTNDVFPRIKDDDIVTAVDCHD